MSLNLDDDESSEILLLILQNTENDLENIILLLSMVGRNRRRILIRSVDWFRCNVGSYTENQFKEAFRMSTACFKLILDRYISELIPLQINNDNRVEFSLTLYFVTRPITYRDAARLFGLPSTNAYRMINKVLKIFNEVLVYSFCKLPEIEEMNQISELYLQKSSLEGTILAIDGTHVPIDAPKICPERYINRKGWHSVNFQCVVDANCVFRNIFGVFPGSCHDAYVFRRSSFRSYVEFNIPDPYYVIGDAAYPIMNHLKRPFKGNLTIEQAEYNYKLSAQRMTVERAFGYLKGRFKRFRYPNKNGEKEPFSHQFIFAF